MQVEDFFTHLLQRVVPKHDTQARAEVTVTRRFLENFSADQACPQHLPAHTLTCRQPSADTVAEGLPQAVLDNDANPDDGHAKKSLLYMRDSGLVRPALESGAVVITDRFISATLAYQLGGDGLTADEIRAVGRIAVRDRLPDLTIILDMPAEASIKRVQAKFVQVSSTLFGNESTTVKVKDRIEQRPLEYHRVVRENFLAQAKNDPKAHLVIAADRTPDEVGESVWAAVRELAARE